MVYTYFEHQILHPSHFVYTSDFDWLLQKTEADELPCFTITVQNTRPVLRSKHYLTVIRLPSGHCLEVLPKVANSQPSDNLNTRPSDDNLAATRLWVANMLASIHGYQVRPLPALAKASQLVTATSNVSDQHWQTWLLPIVQQWQATLLHVLPKLPKHYQSQQQNHPQAQGKLLIKAQLRHNQHRPHYRYTQQQRMQLHPLWTDVFATTAIHSQRLGVQVATSVIQGIHQRQSSTYKSSTNTNGGTHSLKQLPVSVWQSSLVQLRQWLDSSLPASLYQDLQLLLRLSELILTLQSASLNVLSHDSVTPAVMLNMQHLFELWVSQVLQQHYPNRTKTQQRFLWLSECGNKHSSEQEPLNERNEGVEYNEALLISTNTISPVPQLKQQLKQQQRYLQPDVVIYQQQSEQNKQKPAIWAVAEIKYKAISSMADINASDLYQLMTYYQQLNAEQAWLIYPQSEGLPYPIRLRTHHQADNQPLYIDIIPFVVSTGELVLPGRE